MENMARFGRREYVRMPDDGEWPFRLSTGSPAFLACIWLINEERPGTFMEPRITVDGAHTVENYPDARVIFGNGDDEQRENEGIRIVADNPALVPLLQEKARWVYANSFEKRDEPCSVCETPSPKGSLDASGRCLTCQP